jgi:hypothetical protein
MLAFGLSADDIRTSRGSVSVPFERRQELVRRLEAFGEGGREAAEDLRAHRVFAESRTPFVIEVLHSWATQEDIGDELRDLQTLLWDDEGRDLPA